MFRLIFRRIKTRNPAFSPKGNYWKVFKGIFIVTGPSGTVV
jgi:hypothetical protein